jgi:dienelactone hydrolase
MPGIAAGPFPSTSLLGFGRGGLLAFLAAGRMPVAAALAFQPDGIERHCTPGFRVRAPFVLHFAGADSRTPTGK